MTSHDNHTICSIMFTQKLKSSCKYISVSLGLLSSYLSFKYQNTLGVQLDATLATNFDQIHRWMRWKAEKAVSATEIYLLQYCHILSKSPLFHRTNITSLLIYLASSDNQVLHELCVKFLAVLEFPKDFDFDYYLRKCSHEILIGLARSKDLNTQWFQQNHDISHGDSIQNISQLLKEIQLCIPVKEPDCSTWLYTKVMNETLPTDPITNVMADFCTERDSVNILSENNPSKEEIALKYLDILRRYSNNNRIIRNRELCKNIVVTVKNVINDFHENKNILFLCGNIIGNISVNKSNRDYVVSENLLPVFVQWRKSRDLMLGVVADRVLFNLDHVYEKSSLSDGIYICHPNYRTTKKTVDVVFIHGIKGSPFYTWKLNDKSKESVKSSCWPKDWLPVDNPDARIICCQYDSYLTDWMLSCPINKNRYSLENQAELLKNKLVRSGIGDRPIVWVSHSMGGLIVKKILLTAEFNKNDQQILKESKGIVFYSVPHLGSPIATRCEKARYILFPSVEVNELSENSEHLKLTHTRFTNLVRKYCIQCTDLGELQSLSLPYIKMNAVIVPRESSDVGYGRYMLLDANHQDICKPHSKSDLRYLEVNSMIHDVINQKTLIWDKKKEL